MSACTSARDDTPNTIGRVTTEDPEDDDGAPVRSSADAADTEAVPTPTVTPDPPPPDGAVVTPDPPPPDGAVVTPDPPPPDDPVVPPPLPPGEPIVVRDPDAGAQTCWFVYLGDWFRCAEVYEPESASSFDTRSACGQACLEDPLCTSIIDWSWVGGYGCRTYRSTACTPIDADYGEEDAGRAYVVQCGDTPPPGAILAFDDLPGLVSDPASGCRFMSLGDSTSCEGDVDWGQAVETHGTLVECLAACEANPSCTAVKDAFIYEPAGFECALHMGTCSAPVSGTFGTRFYEKECY